MRSFDRRDFCFAGAAGAAALVAGCAPTTGGAPLTEPVANAAAPRAPAVNSNRSGQTVARPKYDETYGTYPGEEFPIPAFDYSQVDPIYLRQQVAYLGPEGAGTVVVDPSARQLFFVEPNRLATRYGVGVGREGFLWSGQARINMRRSWPDWIPPHEMVERDPTVRPQLVETPRGLGVPGGPRSPLGARAMYLYGEHGGDLGYRIHGTTEPETIGTYVSSGCIRMVDQDVIHLYSRTPMGAQVVVLPT
jgi:lipoprotein-anchoring transpeptidase ErfK/SrfK